MHIDLGYTYTNFFIEIVLCDEVVQCRCPTENKRGIKEYSRKLRRFTALLINRHSSTYN